MKCYFSVKMYCTALRLELQLTGKVSGDKSPSQFATLFFDWTRYKWERKNKKWEQNKDTVVKHLNIPTAAK